METLYIHCDMNNYFASVEALDKPYLNSKPFVVSGDPKLRHGIILSKNDLAKRYNIITGESLMDAKRKCSDLVVVSPNYQKYFLFTKKARAIYLEYATKIYPYGLDEAWLDVSNKCKDITEATSLARFIKKRIYNELGLEISCGVSFSKIFAKLGSDEKLKNDVFVISREDYLEITKNMPAFKLLFVGKQARRRLKELNILSIGDLRNADLNVLKRSFGKKGALIYDFAFGIDDKFNPLIENENEIKSIGNTITAPKDIVSEKSVEEFIYLLSNIISTRLRKHNLKTRTVFLGIKYYDYSTFRKQTTICSITNYSKEIFNTAYNLYLNNDFEKPIRSITIRVSNLITSNIEQISLFEDNNNQEDLLQKLQKKYGSVLLEQSNFSKGE